MLTVLFSLLSFPLPAFERSVDSDDLDLDFELEELLLFDLSSARLSLVFAFPVSLCSRLAEGHSSALDDPDLRLSLRPLWTFSFLSFSESGEELCRRNFRRIASNSDEPWAEFRRLGLLPKSLGFWSFMERQPVR